MAEATLDELEALHERLAEEVRAVSPAQGERLEHIRLHKIAVGQSEEEAARNVLLLVNLIRAGLISQLPIPPTDPAYEPPPPFTPIVVQGEPVSETIIRERR